MSFTCIVRAKGATGPTWFSGADYPTVYPFLTGGLVKTPEYSIVPGYYYYWVSSPSGGGVPTQASSVSYYNNASWAFQTGSCDVRGIGGQAIINKVADNLPLILAICFTMAGVFWIVRKLIKAARLKRP